VENQEKKLIVEPFYPGQEIIFTDGRNREFYGYLMENYEDYNWGTGIFEDDLDTCMVFNLAYCRPYVEEVE
jgi:hypothetical protein